MSMTAVELAEQRWMDRRVERTCRGCPERGTSYCATRRGTSNYFGCDYRQIQPCPHCVAEAGMEIYVQIKHLLRRARKEKKNAIAMRRDKSRL